MPLFNSAPDDEILTDGSRPVAGVNNSQPPSAIPATSAEDAENRLAQLDGLNRPRPGIIRLKQPSGSLDSIHHLGTGVFLANFGSNWYRYDNRGNVLATLAGGPAYAPGSQVYSAVANTALYFSDGSDALLHKYAVLSTTGTTNATINITAIPSTTGMWVGQGISGAGIPAGATIASIVSGTAITISVAATASATGVVLTVSGFGTVALPSAYPRALYPIWAVYRLIYAYQNTLVVSDSLDPETFHIATGELTLDPITTDVITGQALWQNQAIAVFRNGSTWMVQTGPGLDVPDWSLDRVSATVGCRCHGTIVQCGADVLFLSESGRGVYALSQAPTSSQIGVWTPISVDIQKYINRINWSACDNARATYWNDLYILSVPLDGSTFNNFCLVYSFSLQTWQGLWCFDIGSVDTAVRDFARDRTDPNHTALLVATKDGIISRFTYPVDRQYYDQNIDGTQQYYDSVLRTRSFIFGINISEQYMSGINISQLRPHSVRFQFLESVDPVTVSVIADRTIELLKRTLDTSGYLLSLTIPGFPFDLDVEGYQNAVIGLLGTGICNELQFEFEATGNWTLYQIKASAFETMPDLATQ
jgi:hypothetical protein